MSTLSKTSSRSWVLPRHELEVPRQLAGCGIQRQHAVRVERVAVRLARHAGPRLGLRGRPVGQVGLRVVAARNPGVGAGAERQRQVAPGIAPRLPGPRDGGGAPHLLSGIRIVGRDEADVVLVVLAAGHSGDDVAVHHDRAAGVAIAQAVVGDGVIPDHLAGGRVQGHDVGVGRVDEDLVAVDGDRARAHAGADRVEEVGRGIELPAVLPEAVPGRRVHRLHDVAGAGDEHHAVVHERRRLAEPLSDLPAPDELQLVDVLPADLIQRAVAPAV